MSSVEVTNSCRGFDSFCRFPTNILIAIACPFDLELKFPTEDATVQNLFHIVVFLSIYNSRWWWWLCTATGNGIGNGRGEFDGMEYWVNTRHGTGKAETVSQMANLTFDNVWSEILVREFLGWPAS